MYMLRKYDLFLLLLKNYVIFNCTETNPFNNNNKTKNIKKFKYSLLSIFNFSIFNSTIILFLKILF